MSEQPDDAFTFSDVVHNLIQLGVDARTIANVINCVARESWYTQRDKIVASDGDMRTTALGFAAELDEHCHRAHGINVAMIGLREMLGEETCISGTHQLTIDLSDHAQRLKRLYGALLLEIGMN